jgi:hypothetical protein
VLAHLVGDREPLDDLVDLLGVGTGLAHARLRLDDADAAIISMARVIFCVLCTDLIRRAAAGSGRYLPPVLLVARAVGGPSLTSGPATPVPVSHSTVSLVAAIASQPSFLLLDLGCSEA